MEQNEGLENDIKFAIEPNEGLMNFKYFPRERKMYIWFA